MAEVVRTAVRFLGIAAAAFVLSCTPNLVSPEPTVKPSYALAPPTPTISPLSTAGPAAHARPYSAADLVTALGDAGNGFPVELREPWLAALLADRIWSYDGKPYRELTASGSCDDGAPRCDLQLTGLPGFAQDRKAVDGYAFTVDLAAHTLTLAGLPALKGFPSDLTPALDQLVRSRDTLDQLDGMFLRYTVWVVPPPEDAYALAYATGTQEGDRGLTVIVDRAAGTIVSVVPN